MVRQLHWYAERHQKLPRMTACTSVTAPKALSRESSVTRYAGVTRASSA